MFQVFNGTYIPPPSLYYGKDGDSYFLRNIGNFIPVQASLFPDYNKIRSYRVKVYSKKYFKKSHDGES
jgi:hypothetical protein